MENKYLVSFIHKYLLTKCVWLTFVHAKSEFYGELLEGGYDK